MTELDNAALGSLTLSSASHSNAEDLIREMTNLVDRYVQHGKAQVFQQRRRDREFTIEQDKKLSQMKHTKKKLKEAQEKVEREREKEARQLALAQQKLTDVKAVEEKLPKELDVLRRELKNQERVATRLQATVSTKRAMAQVRSQELRKAVQCYGEWLGLSIESEREDKIRFVFSRLSRSQPQREAYLVLQTDATGVSIEECEPQLGAAAIKVPLEQFKRDDNLSSFICAIRRLFVQSLQ